MFLNMALFIATTFISCASVPPWDFDKFDSAENKFYSKPPEYHPSKKQQYLDDTIKKDEITLEDVLIIADLKNPTLNSSRKDVDISNAQIWDASLYPNPQLIFQVDDYQYRQSGIDSTKRSGGISIPLVIGGRIGSAKSVAETRRDITTLNYVWQRRNILTQVKEAFFNVLSAQESVYLNQESFDLSKSFSDLTETRLKAGAAPEIDFIRATVALSKAQTNLTTSRKQLEENIKTLQSLMGNANLPVSKFKGVLRTKFNMPGLEELHQTLTNNPLIQSTKMERELHEREIKLLHAQNISDIQLQIVPGKESDNSSFVFGTLQFTLPVFDYNQAKIVISRYGIEQAQMHFQQATNDAITGLTNSYKNLEDAQRRVDAYENVILPKAQRALDQTKQGYSMGKFTYLDVIDAQHTLVDSRAEYVQALTDLNTADAELEKVTGLRLEHLY